VLTSVGSALRLAFRRPGLIAAFFVLRTAFAVFGAVLWSSALSPKWLMALPDQDASLFRPGLLLTLRLFAENRERLSARVHDGIWLALAYVLTGALVTACVLHALRRADESESPGPALPTWDALARQVATVAGSWVLVLLAIYVAQYLARILPPLVYGLFGEKGADAALLGVGMLLGVAVIGVRITSDLMRAALTKSRQPYAAILAEVLIALRFRWRFWLGTYACFTLPLLGLPIVAQLPFPILAEGLDFDTGRLLVHQAVVVASCALQLGWWALLLAHVPVPQSPQKRT